MSIKVTKNDFAENGATLGLEMSNLETAIAIASEAKALAPVKFGQLKNSIMVKSEKEESGFNDDSSKESAPSSQKLTTSAKEADVYVGTNSDHWYPEFGTRSQVAQPFLRPAKDIVVNGTTAKEIGIKYGREAMQEEFAKRKVKKRELGR